MGKYSRGISILVSIAMTCSLVACGSNSNSGQTVSKTGGSLLNTWRFGCQARL